MDSRSHLLLTRLYYKRKCKRRPSGSLTFTLHHLSLWKSIMVWLISIRKMKWLVDCQQSHGVLGPASHLSWPHMFGLLRPVTVEQITEGGLWGGSGAHFLWLTKSTSLRSKCGMCVLCWPHCVKRVLFMRPSPDKLSKCLEPGSGV